MTQISDPLLDEALRVFPAWQDLVARVMPGNTDPVTVEPRDVFEAMDDLPNEAITRLAHLMIANSYADSITGGAKLLGQLHGMAAVGQRPRFLGEMGQGT